MLIHLADALTGKMGVTHVEVPLDDQSFRDREFDGRGIVYTFAGEDNFADFVITYKENHKVKIEAKLSLQCEAPCSRCLKPVSFPLDLGIEREVDFDLTEDERREAMDEMNFIHEFDLDTDILIQEEILLNCPLQILCDDDCKGLCPQCGCDRNKEICSCDEAPKDPRMAAIAELFRQSVLENSK